MLCWNALDNVEARKCTDARCLFYSKLLLESGTLGTKCNHEIILLFRTSSYNNGKESDTDEGMIATCPRLRFLVFLADPSIGCPNTSCGTAISIEGSTFSWTAAATARCHNCLVKPSKITHESTLRCLF